MAPTARGLTLVGLPAPAFLALAFLALVLLLLAAAPASAESIDLYELEEISTAYGADAVAVRADGAEGVVVWSDRNTTTGYYDNYVFTTTGTTLSQKTVLQDQTWYWRSAAFATSGNTCLLGGSRGYLYKYDGSTVSQVTTGMSYDIIDIEWVPGTNTAYMGVSTRYVYLYSGGSVSRAFTTYSSVYDLDVRPDGGEVVVASYSYVELYNTSRGDIDQLMRPTDDDGYEYYYVYAVEYSPNGDHFLANWYSGRQYAMLRYANNKWSQAARINNRVEVMMFENEGTFVLIGMNNNLQYLQGGAVTPVPDWFTTGGAGVYDLDYNHKDFYFLVASPDGVYKLKRKPNVRPWLDRPIPDLEFDEDEPGGGDDLLDLSVFVRDDRNFGKLRFEFDFQQDESLLKGRVDGQYLHFTQVVEHWNGKMAFRLKVWDSGGDDVPGSADDMFNRTNMFNVTVRQVNDPVSLVNLGDKTVGVDDLVWFVEEGTWLNLSIVTEDVDNDPEEIQPPRFAINRSLASIKIDAEERMITFMPRNKDVGSIYLNLTVTDGFGSYDHAEMVIHVSNVNNPPKLQGIRDRKVKEDNYLNFTVSARDEDLEIGIENSLAFSTNRTDGVGDDDLPNFGFRKSDVDPTRINVWFLPTNEDVGEVWVEFRVSDGFGPVGEWQDVRSMLITVQNTNDAPFIVEANGVSTAGLTELPLSATEDEGLSVSLLADDDDEDPLFYYVDDSRFSLSQPGGGYEATVVFTPGDLDVGTVLVTVSVWDVYNTYDDLVLNISVQNVNDPPELLTFEGQSVSGVEQVEFTAYEDVLFTAPITVHDVDSVTISFSDNLDLFAFDLSGDPMTAVANFTPSQEDVGMITVILEVDDGDGGSDAIVVILNVIATNDPPGVPTVSQLAFDSLAVPLRATQVDDPDGDDLTYTWEFGDHTEPVSGTDLFDVTHEYPRSGTYGLVLTVTDGNGGESRVEYEVLVPETGEEPPETVVEEGPVWLVVVLIALFVAMTVVILFLYWKLPRNGNGDT
jgi:hypothetical protein